MTARCNIIGGCSGIINCLQIAMRAGWAENRYRKARSLADLPAPSRKIESDQIFRNPTTKYVVLAIAAAAIMIAALSPLASVLVEGWSRRDVELRARLVFRSIRGQVVAGLAATPNFDIGPFFEQLTGDERLLAMGYCTDMPGKASIRDQDAAKGHTCKSLPLTKADSFVVVPHDGLRIHVSAFPVKAGSVAGHLLVLHDLTYIDERVKEARLYSILAIVGWHWVWAACDRAGAGLDASMDQFHSQCHRQPQSWRRPGRCPRVDFPISKEIRTLLAEFRSEREFTDGIHVEWSPKTLHRLLEEELPGTEVMVVSNREPYIHNRGNEGVVLQIPASGLVAALEPVMRACGGTWIAHGSGTADRETVDRNDRHPGAACGPRL